MFTTLIFVIVLSILIGFVLKVFGPFLNKFSQIVAKESFDRQMLFLQESLQPFPKYVLKNWVKTFYRR